jgi:hypothetical protein
MRLGDWTSATFHSVYLIVVILVTASLKWAFRPNSE